MKIEGDITIDDYIRSARALPAPHPSWFRVARIANPTCLILVAGICGYLLAGILGMRFFILGAACVFVAAWPLNQLVNRLFLSHYRANAWIHNLGNATYELTDNGINFTGSTFNVTIPISSIKEVVSASGTGLLVFGNQSCFVVPHQITAGDLPSFLDEIRRRIAVR